MILHIAAVEYTATALLAPQLRWLNDHGYDARLACAPDGAQFRDSLADFRPVPLAFPRSGDPRRMLAAGRRFVALINELRPDIVHLHTPATAIPIRMIPRRLFPRRTRVVYTVHGFAHVWDGGGWRDLMLERVERQLAGRTDLMLFQSTEDLDQTRRHGYRTTLRYLGNGVEDLWFDVPPPAERRGPLRLIFVGRLVEEKGVLDLLEAMASVPDAELSLVGTELPTERHGVELVARKRADQPDLRGRVRFLGAVPKARMPEVVAGCDALVLPSYREGVPRSMIEGFATGRPAVATDVRGCRELVTDGVTGFLVPPRRPDRLAAALRRLAALPEPGFRSLSTAARDLAHRTYRERTVVDRLVAAYTELGVLPASPAVVGDDLARADLGSRAVAEEVERAGAVSGGGIVDDSVEGAQPEQRGADHATCGLRPGQSADEMVQAPQQLRARSGGHAGIDLVEGAE
jgi:glycosyltransferase involved in cell wall biosynthesis